MPKPRRALPGDDAPARRPSDDVVRSKKAKPAEAKSLPLRDGAARRGAADAGLKGAKKARAGAVGRRAKASRAPAAAPA